MRGGRIALAALLALAAAAALLRTGGGAPAAGRETTYWLAIESLAVDGDVLLEEADRARFTRRFGLRPHAAQVDVADGASRLEAPWLWTRLAAAARGALGAAGVTLLQCALFLWTAGVAAATLSSRLGGGSAGLLVATSLFASAAFALPFRLEPRALEMAAMATAAAAIWYRRLGPARGPDDVYRGDLVARPALARWLVAGGAFALVLAASPAYLPLALPLLAAAGAGRRGAAAATFAVGLAAVAAPLLTLAGAPWPPLAGAPSAALYGWSAAGLLLGRGVGLLPYFVPAVLLVTLGGREEGKRLVPAAVAAALTLQLATAPFDFVDGALAPGNAWFLPPLALLLLAAEASESARSTLAVAAIGLVLLAAPWAAALGATGAAAAIARRLEPAERLLPAASTLRLQPGAADLARGGLAARGLPPGVVAAADGKLRLVAARGDLVITADRPLSSLRLELGREAPAQLEVRGGKLGNTIYRPSGEVAVDVAVDPRKARRHPVWWSPGGAWSYPLEVRLPASPASPLPLDLPFGRLAIPEGATP